MAALVPLQLMLWEPEVDMNAQFLNVTVRTVVFLDNMINTKQSERALLLCPADRQAGSVFLAFRVGAGGIT